MRDEEWETTGNAVYNTGYHLVWSLKYRKAILKPPIDRATKDILIAICIEKGFRVMGLEVMSEHVHIFVAAPPRVNPAEIARLLGGISSRRLIQRHPEIKRKLWGGHLWNPSYSVGTAGQVSAKTIQRYIENQRVKG